MIKMGYKVVSLELESAAVYCWYGRTTYEVGKSVCSREGCGPLTVFTNLYGATHFRSYLSSSLRIFKCCYTPSLHDKVWFRVSYSNYYETITKSLKTLIDGNPNCIIPDSVDLAQEVLLLEELYDI